MTDNPLHPYTKRNPAAATQVALSVQTRSHAQNNAIAYATALMIHYCLDLDEFNPQEWIESWLNEYPATWLGMAVIEALYLGRYKAVSVEQILKFWKRRGKPMHHFTHEFERLVCRRFPRSFRVHILDRGESAPVSDPTDSALALTSSAAVSEENAVRMVSALVSSQADLLAKIAQKRARQIPPATQPTEIEQTSQPIHRFVPAPRMTDFHDRLVAVMVSSENS
jgi:hypothetical protein